jgi:hypothetical protein
VIFPVIYVAILLPVPSYILQCLIDFVIQNMGVPKRRSNAPMIEHLLNELQITGPAQGFRRKVMPEIVKAEVSDTRPVTQSFPCTLHIMLAQRISFPLDAILVGELGDIGEHEFGMMSLQRFEYGADCRSDRSNNSSTSLSDFHDLTAMPIHFRPTQTVTFLLP